MQDQISTGALIIRHMTASERASCAREREQRNASMTPSQRARCGALLRERRRRAALFASSDTDAGPQG
jgi:hypothetical protein